MTEHEWDGSSDPTTMLAFLRADGRSNERKLRLFAVACFRRVWHRLPEGPARLAVETAERYADGRATVEELRAAHEAANQAARELPPDPLPPGQLSPGIAAWVAAPTCTWLQAVTPLLYAEAREAALGPETAGRRVFSGAGDAQRMIGAQFGQLQAAMERQLAGLCDLLREVFGDPFHPVVVDPAWLAWDSGSIPKLAQSVYEERAFDRMPALADALAAAGCADARILGHCRSGQGHVRGCWVLDALLAKTANQSTTAAPGEARAGPSSAVGEGGLDEAIATGDAERVRALLRSGTDPNRPDAQGVSPLARAADAGRLDVVRALVEGGAHVDHESGNPTGEKELGPVVSPLLLAEFRGHRRVYDYLHRRAAKKHRNEVAKQRLKIKKRRNKEMLRDPRVAALLRAVKTGDAAAVAALVADGVEVNVSDEDNWGTSALATAAFRGDAPVVRVLLDGGADPNEEGCSGILPLLAARDVVVAEALLRAGADPNRGKDGGTALNAAAALNRTDLLAVLIAAGAELDAPTEPHGCALSTASAQGHLEAVRLLLGAGASVHTCPKKGWPPLMHAAAAGHEAVVRALVAAGADVQYTDREGETPLGVASDHPGVVEVLTQFGTRGS